MSHTNSPNSSFKLCTTRYMESLKCHIYEYEHLKTGAKHIHLANDYSENVFMVAFRTFPQDSSGSAHILEHTALCGSEKYPVRDPFFLMIRRSLNSFMNAFTASDWTAYPFATQNRQDFDNLLSVYLDAAFFSRLHPLDFAQEGIRVEFEKMDDPTTDLVYKGVVFNEMKGAMSAPSSMLYRTLSQYLCPTTTYHYNSGGDPEHIPDLTYDQLITFYKTYYHPSNAIFFTFGNIDAQTHQAVFEKNVLSRFDRSPHFFSVPLDKRYAAPLKVETSYSFEGKDTQKQTHHVLAWLLDESIDAQKKLECQLLKDILLDNSSSPLRHALETYPHAGNLSPLCFLEDGHREMSFVCGVEGSDPEHAEHFENYVMELLTKLAHDGIEQSQVDAMLHQFELKQREITGDRYPFGLQLILEILPTAIHRGDVFASLDLENSLSKLREAFSSPEFVKKQIQRLFLDNAHRVRLTLKPSSEMSDIKLCAEKARLEKIKSQFTDEEKQEVIKTAQALKARQEAIDDENILPKVTLNDVPKQGVYLKPKIDSPFISAEKQRHGTGYTANSNGIAYHQLILDLPELDENLTQLLPVYTELLTEIGTDHKSYLETQAWQSSVCGGLHASYRLRAGLEKMDALQGHFFLSSKCLNKNFDKMCELMEKTFTHVKFDEVKRIRELITQARYESEESVVGSGHTYAMDCAASQLSPFNFLDYQLSGMKGIKSLKLLDERLNQNEKVIEEVISNLRLIHEKMLAAPLRTLVIAEENHIESFFEQHQQHTKLNSAHNHHAYQVKNAVNQTENCWLINAQVNYCSKAYKTVAQFHPDAAALSVLAPYLKNTFLHRAIREQGGAYGGGASYDTNNGIFRFYSYRDPRLLETFQDFDRSIQSLLNDKQNHEHLEQATLGIMADIDKPKAPAKEAFQNYLSELQGRSPAFRQTVRDRLFNVTLEDLRRVTETYLLSDGKIALLTSETHWAKVGDALPLKAEHL